MKKSTSALVLSTIICFLVAIGLLLLLWLRPDPNTQGGQRILLWSLVGASLLLGLIGKIFSPRPKCTIFFGPERELYYDSERGYIDFRYIEKSCGQNAVGSVRAGHGDRVYFCRWHDPRKIWMQEWLAKRDFSVKVQTIKIFEPDEDAEDDDRSSPDLPRYF